ncbi:MAG TPA: hypothetical protein VKJ77_21330, partial [Caballeronia sp.]|nr:hypothetical protein [Caballeronia sp.]
HSAQPTFQELREWASFHEDSSADKTTNQQKMEPQKARGAVQIPWKACLPESVRGEACACKNSREGGFHKSVVLASTVLLGCQKRGNCTLGQLMSPRFESAFFASFLCRFGQRNDVPPRAVANSDKENIRLMQTTKAESSNPA